MGLVQTIPPAILPVTLDQIKGQLNLALDDKSRDGRLLLLAKAATNLAERATGRAFLTQTWRLSLDWRFPSCERWIVLPRPPVQSITQIDYTDSDGQPQTLDPAKYHLAADKVPAIVEPAFGEVWPTTQEIAEAVRITYQAGYGGSGATNAESLAAVPEDAKLAILLAVQTWFDSPFADELVMPGAALMLLKSLSVGTYRPSYPV